MSLWVADWETSPNIAEISFLAYDDDTCHTFIIDDDTKQNDSKKLAEFIRGQTIAGYNSKTFDDLLTNFVIRHPNTTAAELFRLSNKIINGQKQEDFNLYKEFAPYLKSDLYKSIDLMRLLFSKKLRVGLKELECSLQHDNVSEFECPFDKVLTAEEKLKLIEYNINDCRATKLVLQKSMEALQLRRWMFKEYGVDAYSMDSVNGGVKILELTYERFAGNAIFKDKRTFREWINISDIILPQVKFDTPEFQAVLKVYQDHIWYSKHYDEELFEDSKLMFEPLINGFKFKFSLGGLHGYTLPGTWESDEEYEIYSVDVASYYPSMVLKHRFCPGHLKPEIFLKAYQGIKDERMVAKKAGDKLKDTTLKFAINGSYGMFGNRYSWLFDHKVRLQICVNGQLFLAMLIEKLMAENMTLIDANTDGIYVRVHKSQTQRFREIVKEWESVTLMEMEFTKFEKMWFLNTADYIGTYESKGKIAVKEKGMFLSTVQLGKGMEFPVIASAIKKHCLDGTPIEQTIQSCKDILQFCSYKRLNKDTECWHNKRRVQRINRFYAAKTGAYLYRRSFDEKKQKWAMSHLLKESPVIIYNKFDEKPITERNINYGFYQHAAREAVFAIMGDRAQGALF